MKCEFCKEEISPGALACPRCGGPVVKPLTQAPQGEAGGPPAQGMPVGPAPGATVPEVPIDPPLAKVEEDFIALAEEAVTLEGDGPAVVQPAQGDVAVPENSVPADALAAAPVPPGAHAANGRYVPDTSLTGGYKGPETASVAGAGVQTADDPFGLNITERSPEDAAREPVTYARHWRYSRWWNLTMMFVGILILIAGLVIGLYFGVIRKPGPGSAPVEALTEYVNQVVAGDTSNLNRVSVPGSTLANDVAELLKSLEKEGIMTLKSFEVEPVKVTDDSASLKITKFNIELDNEKGGKQVLSVLDITKPFELLKAHPTIEVIRQNGNWLVKT